jgi:hypothetical protein
MDRYVAVTVGAEPAIIDVQNCDIWCVAQHVIEVKPDVRKNRHRRSDPSQTSMGHQRFSKPPITPPVWLQSARQGALRLFRRSNHTTRRPNRQSVRIPGTDRGVCVLQTGQVDGEAVVGQGQIHGSYETTHSGEPQPVLDGIGVPCQIRIVREWLGE